MAKLRVSKISIRNILGVEEVEFEPGRLTVIKGANGTGKTSVLEAIRATLRGGNDATLVRQGAIEGEVVLVLEDGTELNKRINDKSSSVTVRHPAYGKVSKPQTVIDSLVNQLGINPIDLLTAPAARQKEIFLKAIPLKVTQEQVEAAIGMPIGGDFEQHVLDVLDDVSKSIYTHRTGLNRALKEKQATAKQLEESLPEQPPEGDWQSQYEHWSEELAKLDREHLHRTHVITTAKVDNLKGQQEFYADAVRELRRQAQEEIDRINAQLAADTEALRVDYEAQRQQINDAADEAQEAVELEVADRRLVILEQKQHAKTMADMHLKSESARQLLDQMQLDYTRLLTEAKNLTRALEGVDKLKESLMQDLPIKGLEVRDGELYLFAIPFSRWNEAVRVKTAIDVAKLSAGNLGMIIVDGLERLDADSFKAFTDYVQADETCQYVVSRVTEDPQLNIETY